MKYQIKPGLEARTPMIDIRLKGVEGDDPQSCFMHVSSPSVSVEGKVKRATTEKRPKICPEISESDKIAIWQIVKKYLTEEDWAPKEQSREDKIKSLEL